MTHVLTHRGLPDGMNRWDLYGLLVKAPKHFGLTDTTLKYLRFAISRTQDQDYAAGRICALWPSVSETASQLEADPRQIARAEAHLAELGFIVTSSAARCRRYGVRSENFIRYAFGINLAPLVDRTREIEAAARKVCFEKEEAKRLRLHIPKLLERARTSGDASAEEVAEATLPSRHASRIWRYARLKEIADALEALIEALADAPVAVEMSDRCDAEVAHRVAAPHRASYPCAPPGQSLNADRGSELRLFFIKKFKTIWLSSVSIWLRQIFLLIVDKNIDGMKRCLPATCELSGRTIMDGSGRIEPLFKRDGGALAAGPSAVRHP
ncbi:helix-turn-helix domain-containing protein [Chachezhania sediminis]|uniref:helix-turn-helix domain-containing protein n=1 Tax=Chachezhania sediminis TaxID=2599291 RepID=UPI00131E231F|nr:helix-turn-helix domain-containing protein [Chachezhania sediminis]